LAELAASAQVFENARSVSTYTLSSHLSMLTGVHPSHHGARMTRQRFHPLETPTVVRAFREAGYRTGAFVGTDVLRAQSGISHAFESYCDQVDPWVTYTHAWALMHDVQSFAATLVPALRQNGLPHWIQDFQRPAREVLDEARAWIESGDARPWFCFVNLYDVHWPYLPEPTARNKWVQPYDGIVDGYTMRGDRVVRAKYTPVEEDHRHLRELYDAELWELDRAVDRFLAGLDLDATAVLITSDHGEAFGEGGQYEHANILECQTRVPLIVRPAGGTTPERRVDPRSGVDVAPTLLELAGLPASASHVGRSLLAPPLEARAILIEDRDHPRPEVVRIALIDEHWKLVRYGVGEQQSWKLFDLRTDQLDAHDRCAEHPEVVERLRKRMDELRASWRADDARDMQGTLVGNVDALDALGYAGNEPEPDERP
jgi:arylsulfatase A-like enzyme